jgi:hypothetical protein
MPLHVKSGGTWREATGISVRDGGTWRTIQDGYIKDGGVWRQFKSGAATVQIDAHGSPSSGTGGRNTVTYTVSSGTTFYISFSGGNGGGANMARVNVDSPSNGYELVIAGGGGASGSQNGGGGGPGGGANGSPGNPAPNTTGGGGGVTNNSGSGPGGSGGSGGPHSGRGCSGFPGGYLTGAPTCYSNSGGGGGYYGGGSGGSNFDSNTGGGGGGGSGLIRNWSLPANLSNLTGASFSSGGSTGQKVILTVNGTPTTYTSNTSVTI